SVETNSQLIKKVNYKKELADVKYRVDAGRFMPSVAAMGTYDIVNKDLSPYLPHYMVGVGLKWNVFQGASRVRNVQAAKLQQQQVEQVYHKATSDISTAITKFYQETQMYMEQMRELESASEFAEEYYRVRKKAFSEGMATAAEVSDADLAVAKVQIETLVAQYQFDVALAKTLYYSGKMHELNNFTNQQ
ncbi:MAG: TolC family protein, partial [Bacteroidales bacterium]|nr:TolC family protein [Bacteroidales bacterium]